MLKVFKSVKWTFEATSAMNENEEKHNEWEQGNNTVPSHILSAESWTQRKRERKGGLGGSEHAGLFR